MDTRLFSLVIPCFNQEKTIKKNILEVEKVLLTLPYDYEIIVVVDGGLDKTAEIVKVMTQQNKKVKLLENKTNLGKGYSVKLGMAKARGEVVGFIDSGFDIDPSGILILIDYMKLHDADIVVGSKTHPDSKVNYPMYRKLISFCGRFMTQFLFGFSVLDTQVGLKIFKRNVAKDVFPRLLVKRFAFDIEMLAVANTLGYKNIYEAPVRLSFEAGSISYARLFSVLLKTFIDTLAIYYRIRITKYYRRSNRKNWIEQ